MLGARRTARTGRLVAALALCGTAAVAGLAVRTLCEALGAERALDDVGSMADATVTGKLVAFAARRDDHTTDNEPSRGRPELAGWPLRAAEPLVAAQVADAGTDGNARARGSGACCRRSADCGGPSIATLESQIRRTLLTDFADVLKAAPDRGAVAEELTSVLVGASRAISPERVWSPDAQAFGPNPDAHAVDLPRLRRYVPDGVVRQLGYALPRLMAERDLAPKSEVWTVPSRSGSSTADSDTMLEVRAIVDGKAKVVDWLRMTDAGDPRLAEALADAARREHEYRRQVEAIVGLRVYGTDDQQGRPAKSCARGRRVGGA